MSAKDTVPGDSELYVNLTLEPLLDKYGQPTINADGTFYPNDKFEITYNTETANNIVFEKVEFDYDQTVLNMFNSSNLGSKIGGGTFEVSFSAATGLYPVYLTAWGSRLFDYGRESQGRIGVTHGGADSNAYYSTQYLLTIAGSSQGTITPPPGQYWHSKDTQITLQAVPREGYLFDHWTLNGHNINASNTLTLIIDTPHTLQAHFKQANTTQTPSSIYAESFPSESFETGQFSTHHPVLENQARPSPLTVTFTAHGIGADAIGAALEIDRTTQVNADLLPAKFSWDIGAVHTYRWLETIYSRNSGQRYILNKVTLQEKYLCTTVLPIYVVEYDPHFTLTLAYTVPAGGGSSYDKPFAQIIRYDGNGPTYNLEQRAVIDTYTWTGYAQKIPAIDTMQQQMLTPNITLTNFFNQTSSAQFLAQGIDSKTNPTILTVDGVSFKISDLPKTFLWETNSNHSYSWTPTLPVIDKTIELLTEAETFSEWFEWQLSIAFPPSVEQMALIQANQTSSMAALENQLVQQFNLPHGTLTTTPFGNTITAIYAHNKPIENFAKATGITTNQTLKCLTVLPLYFDAHFRYAKLGYILDPAVAKELTVQGFTDSLYYNLTLGCDLFGKPRYFETNFTAPYEFYDKPLNATPYKWNPTMQTWDIDNTVSIQMTFESAFNFTETDALRLDFETQTPDPQALKLALEDLYDSTPQTFRGTGNIEANLKRTSPLYYNLEIEAGPKQTVTLQRTLQLNFKDNTPYELPLNFDSFSPLQIEVIDDDTQNALLMLDAPIELGGLTNLSVYLITAVPTEKEPEKVPKDQLTLRLLKTLNLTLPQTQIQIPPDYNGDEQNPQIYLYYSGYSSIFEGALGFCGQTQIAIPKDQSLTVIADHETILLYVEATNVWGTNFHQIIPLQPYTSPKWETFLHETALYLLVIVILAIVVSLAVYLLKTK
ncbi:MAG: hypothetical protein LBI79_11005 [Nitrososphaerota archaeon]|jgi:hypothetical protein|nr:hypothetical protein [Nitrososphaerota archaeon]